MKKLLIILFWLVATTVYAQDPDLGGNTIVGTMTPTGPLAIGEPVYFDIITGNAGGDMTLPSPGGAPYSFTIRTTNIGMPSITLTGGTNYYSVPVITSLGNGEYSILITQILPIPEQEYTNFRVTGTTEKTLGTAGFFEAGYSTTVDVSGYAATNSPPDDPSSRREIGNLAITPPVAVANPVPTPNNTPVTIPVLTNDTPGSAAIDPTSVMLITPGTGLPVLTLTVVGEGTYTVNPATGAVTFTPLPTFSGVATPVNYTVEDVNGVVSNQAPITVTVAPPAAVPPVAIADPQTTPYNTPITIAVPANDTPGSAAIDPTSVMLITPGTGLPVLTLTVVGEGTYTVNPATGAVTFTPLPTFSGVATPVNYTVEDVNGVVSNQAPITVTVAPPAAVPPVAMADPQTTPYNTPITIAVPANDTPGSAAIDPTSVMLITPGTGLPVLTLTVVGEGTYTVNPATGAVTFTPLPTFSGVATPVNYTVEDVNGVVSNQAPITVTVAPPAAVPPVAIADPQTTPYNTPITIAVPANDTPGSAAIDPTSVMLITPGTGLPVLTLTVVGEGTYTVNPATGAVTFTPLPTFSGVATPLNYTVEDVNGVVSNQAPITVTVGAPTPPTASNDTPAPNPPGLPLIIPVLSNDTPGSSAIAPASVKLIDPGTGLPVPTVTIPNVGTYTVNLDGTITFTPDPALTTTVPTTVNYTVTDVNGLTSNQATITLNATPLPVTLVSFSVKKEGTVSILNWATTMETNSDHFEIQRSLSGKEWDKIGSVDSHRESTVKQTYTFTDKNPSQGENLYRLKMIDRDATYAYSRIQSVKFDGVGTPAISIYPNPSSDKVFLQDADLAQVKQASILDMTGRAVFSSSKVDSSGINVSKLMPGTYILHVTNLNGSSSSHKIVIVR